jgi:lysophospholipase L1-like esterase
MQKTTRTAFLALAAFYASAFAQQPASITPVPRTEQEEKWVSNHEARVAAAKKGDIDVILLGDSITHYSGSTPAYQRHFGARKTLNLGQGGDRTQNVLWRLQNGEVEGIQPKVAMLMIGTNNIGRGETPEDTILGIKAVLAELKQRLPNTKVVLCSILPRGGAIMAPNPDGSLNETLFGGDKVHLNIDGYRVWFQKAESHIAAALGEAPLTPMAAK